jgi:hypothetical protein
MDDPVAVALERGTGRIFGFFMKTAQAFAGMHGVRRQRPVFISDEFLLGFEHGLI